MPLLKIRNVGDDADDGDEEAIEQAHLIGLAMGLAGHAARLGQPLPDDQADKQQQQPSQERGRGQRQGQE